MLYFIIPLRSKESSVDWEKVVFDFNLTLQSILNQLDPNFKVIVACTDVPDYPADDRVEIIQVSSIYKSLEDGMLDKWNKIKIMCARIRELGGGFIMPVDADDLVSNRISKLVNQGSCKSGYIAMTGYEYDDKRRKVSIAPKFYNLCGTCSVIRCSVEELPENAEDSKKYPILAGHTQWKRVFEEKNTPLTPFPFKPVIYKINTGENDSILTNNIGLKRKVLRFLYRGTPVNKKIREEFSINE